MKITKAVRINHTEQAIKQIEEYLQEQPEFQNSKVRFAHIDLNNFFKNKKIIKTEVRITLKEKTFSLKSLSDLDFYIKHIAQREDLICGIWIEYTEIGNRIFMNLQGEYN